MTLGPQRRVAQDGASANNPQYFPASGNKLGADDMMQNHHRNDGLPIDLDGCKSSACYSQYR
jgi:hypothetical protein